jgi:UDP-glucose 4-epimerase
MPVPAPAARLVAGLVQRRIDASPEQSSLLTFGRVVDVGRLRTHFGYQPQYSTPEAFESLIAQRPVRPVIQPATVRRAELTLARLLRVNPEGDF